MGLPSPLLLRTIIVVVQRAVSTICFYDVAAFLDAREAAVAP